ncbi:MAG: YIP1 family protein, partial [Albidovulum sp.]
LSRVVAGVLGGQGSFFAARIVLFWALLAAAPLMLLRGLVAGLIGPEPQLAIVSGVTFAVFLWFWIAGLRVAEFGGGQ